MKPGLGEHFSNFIDTARREAGTGGYKVNDLVDGRTSFILGNGNVIEVINVQDWVQFRCVFFFFGRILSSPHSDALIRAALLINDRLTGPKFSLSSGKDLCLVWDIELPCLTSIDVTDLLGQVQFLVDRTYDKLLETLEKGEVLVNDAIDDMFDLST